MRQSTGEDFAFLILPSSQLVASVVRAPDSPLEVELFGNRPGMASLANVFLWLHANSFRQEFLSVTALPFVRNLETINLVLRVTTDDPTPERAGRVIRLDHSAQFEWVVPEDDLAHLALAIHRLACNPEHEYDYFPYQDAPVQDARVHVRLTQETQQDHAR